MWGKQKNYFLLKTKTGVYVSSGKTVEEIVKIVAVEAIQQVHRLTPLGSPNQYFKEEVGDPEKKMARDLARGEHLKAFQKAYPNFGIEDEVRLVAGYELANCGPQSRILISLLMKFLPYPIRVLQIYLHNGNEPTNSNVPMIRYNDHVFVLLVPPDDNLDEALAVDAWPYYQRESSKVLKEPKVIGLSEHFSTRLGLSQPSTFLANEAMSKRLLKPFNHLMKMEVVFLTQQDYDEKNRKGGNSNNIRMQLEDEYRDRNQAPSLVKSSRDQSSWDLIEPWQWKSGVIAQEVTRILSTKTKEVPTVNQNDIEVRIQEAENENLGAARMRANLPTQVWQDVKAMLTRPEIPAQDLLAQTYATVQRMRQFTPPIIDVNSIPDNVFSVDKGMGRRTTSASQSFYQHEIPDAKRIRMTPPPAVPIRQGIAFL